MKVELVNFLKWVEESTHFFEDNKITVNEVVDSYTNRPEEKDKVEAAKASIIQPEKKARVTDSTKIMKVVTFLAYSTKLQELFFDMDDSEAEKLICIKYEYTIPIILKIETFKVDFVNCLLIREEYNPVIKR